MRCPFCRAPDSRVVDSRLGKEGDAIRRRRHCERCGRRFTTYERADATLPLVVKKDGRREPFDRQEVVNGLLRACEKRPVPVDTIEAVADRVERQVLERGEREIASSVIGEALMRELHALDAVAYVRFASVYRSFGDVHEFMRELEELIAQRRAEPRQRPARRGGGTRRGRKACCRPGADGQPTRRSCAGRSRSPRAAWVAPGPILRSGRSWYGTDGWWGRAITPGRARRTQRSRRCARPGGARGGRSCSSRWSPARTTDAHPRAWRRCSRAASAASWSRSPIRILASGAAGFDGSAAAASR